MQPLPYKMPGTTFFQKISYFHPYHDCRGLYRALSLLVYTDFSIDKFLRNCVMLYLFLIKGGSGFCQNIMNYYRFIPKRRFEKVPCTAPGIFHLRVSICDSNLPAQHTCRTIFAFYSIFIVFSINKPVK